jgi:hypothetical protein
MIALVQELVLVAVVPQCILPLVVMVYFRPLSAVNSVL